MIVNEGLRAGDLDGIVLDTFTVDQYKSKMGEDKNICVLAFSCNNQAGAKDLEQFLEQGYKFVLDADSTPGTLADGTFKVFVEIPREPKLDSYIREILDDLENLTNIDTFKFTYHKHKKTFEATKANLSEVLPRNDIAYQQKIQAMRLGEVHSFFDKFNMMEFHLDDNIITVIKDGSQEKLRFQLESYGDTQQILKETKAFKIDTDSMAECVYLTKFFGPFNITKTVDNSFIFSKDNISAVVKKYKW